MEPNNGDLLVGVATAAAVLGLKVSTVRRLTAKGELPVVYPTGRRTVRYSVRALEGLIQSRSVPAHPAAVGARAARPR